MSYIGVEELIDRADSSIYKLVVLASKRVRELNAGAGKLVEIEPHATASAIALEEIREGKIKIKPRKQ